MSLRHVSLGCSALLVSLLGACDRAHPAAPSVEATVSSANGPAVKAPSSTNAVATSDSRIAVSWQDNSTNETGFEVWRSPSGLDGTFSKLVATVANVTSYSDAGLSAMTQYCYRVRAFRTDNRSTGYSAFANTACATTSSPPVPRAPSATSSVPTSGSTVRVTWSDNSSTEAGFRVERSLDGGASWTSGTTTAANVTSWGDAGLTSEQQVCHRVVAFNAGGNSVPSNSACTTPPAGPAGLTATASDAAIALAWADNSAVEDGYQVQRSVDAVYWAALPDVPANTTSYRDVAVRSSSTYSYRVRAKKDGGFSDASNTASATTAPATTACVPVAPDEAGCFNHVDDDCDGLTDFADPDCTRLACGADVCPYGQECFLDGFCYSHCEDGSTNYDESDGDCGGSDCQTCVAGQHCNSNFDCASNSCVQGICQP